MAFIKLEDISGCISPVTGNTNGYEIKYNLDHLSSYFKKEISGKTNKEYIKTYVVSCIFNNYTLMFKFLNESDRDSFYTTLP